MPNFASSEQRAGMSLATLLHGNEIDMEGKYSWQSAYTTKKETNSI